MWPFKRRHWKPKHEIDRFVLDTENERVVAEIDRAMSNAIGLVTYENEPSDPASQEKIKEALDRVNALIATHRRMLEKYLKVYIEDNSRAMVSPLDVSREVWRRIRVANEMTRKE